jgi:hypothetical protein
VGGLSRLANAAGIAFRFAIRNVHIAYHRVHLSVPATSLFSLEANLSLLSFPQHMQSAEDPD